MENPFKVGDVVRLKSSGPKMTVTGVIDRYGELTVACAWFEGVKQHNGEFPLGALELASTDEANLQTRAITSRRGRSQF